MQCVISKMSKNIPLINYESMTIIMVPAALAFAYVHKYFRNVSVNMLMENNLPPLPNNVSQPSNNQRKWGKINIMEENI